MRRPLHFIGVAVLLVPAVCFAVVVVDTGNRPNPAERYSEWPGLIDVVNDGSRRSIVWHNGNEWLSFRGDAVALNRMLMQFAEVEADERIVVLVPATRPADKQDSSKPRSPQPFWKLNVRLGALRKHHQGKLEYAGDRNPKLWVYVSDRLPLDAIEMPENITLLQASDIRAQLAQMIATGSKYIKMRGENELREFEEKIPQDGPAADEYQSRLTAIAEFVKRHDAAKSPE